LTTTPPTTDSVPVAAIAAAAGDVMLIEDVTDGIGPAHAVRLRGRLLVPADEAWQRLAERLRPLGRTPLLRRRTDGPGEELLALPVTFRPSQARPAVALLMFALTVLSCLFVGAQMVENATFETLNLLDGWPFALSMLAILTAH